MEEQPNRDTQRRALSDAGRSTVEWLKSATGIQFLVYILACSVDDVSRFMAGETMATDAQVEILEAITKALSDIPIETDDIVRQSAIRSWITQIAKNGTCLACMMREHTAGPFEFPTGDDETERAIIALAIDAYPAFLLPPDDDFPMDKRPGGFVARSLVARHAAGKQFMSAAMETKIFSKAFTHGSPGTGPQAMIYQNDGRAGTVQLMMLPTTILEAAWDKRPEDAKSFAVRAVEQLRIVRELLSGKTQTTTAKVAFTGVLLPPNTVLELPEGKIRPIVDEERDWVPEGLKGQLVGTDTSGQKTTVNYDGDLLFEYEWPLKIRVAKEVPEGVSHPEDLLPSDHLPRIITRLRFSLMLAVPREQRVQLLQTWSSMDQPLMAGRSLNFFDPRQSNSFMPMTLTSEEVGEWREWYRKISAPEVDRIHVALTRILRAMAERREPSDVLIDSVIAWENLFGTKEGEPTFRVTSCLAALLESSLDTRLEFRTKLGKLYTLRSDIVHGSADIRRSDYPRCYEALDVAIRAIRALIVDRPDILVLRDGAQRSASLLLGVTSTPS